MAAKPLDIKKYAWLGWILVNILMPLIPLLVRFTLSFVNPNVERFDYMELIEYLLVLNILFLSVTINRGMQVSLLEWLMRVMAITMIVICTVFVVAYLDNKTQVIDLCIVKLTVCVSIIFLCIFRIYKYDLELPPGLCIV